MNKNTVIGIGVGGVITAIGIYALLISFTLIPVVVNDTVPVGGFTSFNFYSPTDSHQLITIQGDNFHVNMTTPYDGPNIDTAVKDRAEYRWVPLHSGDNIINIQNIGDSELKINGVFETTATPILFIFHMLVLTTGLVIIGISAGFSSRKPRGF